MAAVRGVCEGVGEGESEARRGWGFWGIGCGDGESGGRRGEQVESRGGMWENLGEEDEEVVHIAQVRLVDVPQQRRELLSHGSLVSGAAPAQAEEGRG